MELEKFELDILIKSFLSRGYSALDVADLLRDKINEIAKKVCRLEVFTFDEFGIRERYYVDDFPSIEEARLDIYDLADEYQDEEIVFYIYSTKMYDDGLIVKDSLLEKWATRKIGDSYRPIRNGHTINPETGKIERVGNAV